LTGEELRTRLRERLPEYLVPAVIVILDALPLTANGKVNRAALPAPGAGADEPATPVPPRDERENLIAAVWRGVLGLESVGVHDNYFAVGGDSISAIQVASRLQRAGWQVAVRDLFQHPTIAALAPRLERAGAAAVNETIAGSVPLTPAQAWFFAHHREDRHHFNQAVLLQPRAPLAADAVAAVIAAIWRHHDALRTVFEGENARVLGPALPPVFSEVPVADEVARLAHSESVQRGFDLARGPLFAAVLYRGPQGDRLLLAAHHLVIDGVSWRIVLEDLELGMRQQAAGQPIDLGPKTASIRQWGEAAVGRARAALAESDARYWAAQAQVPSADASELRADARDCYGTARVKAAKLSVDLTRALLTTAHAAYHTEINDLLLVAFGRALQRWRGGAGTLITMEGHGRDPETGLPPVERTVGWFTCLYPVLLTLAGDDLGAQVKHVKETLRAVPAKGIDFGLRTYLAPREAATLAPAPAARISFNYLGQFGEESGGRFAFADEPTGAPIGPHVIRAHELEAGAIVVRGQLALSLTYPPERDATGAMTRLLAGWAGELETVIAHCAGRRTEEKTPADFTSRLFTLPGYEAFLRARNWPAHAVEDVCRLSPLQAGLLFESVFDGASPAYCVQMSYRLRGRLAPDPWVRAWHELAQRHSTLRANFIHAGVDEPFQIVWKERAVEVTMTDLRGVDAAVQAARIAAARAADLARGFDLERDALWRVSGWQTTDDSFEIIWSYHHLLLDGWSLGIVHRDLLQANRALAAGEPIVWTTASPYRDYVGWLARRDHPASRAFWAGYLADYEQPATVARFGGGADGARFEPAEHTLDLGAKMSGELRALAARAAVTLNILFQAAWGLVLARHNRTEDVVFGAVVSGRPADLPGVEEMVGLFICTVPVRVRPIAGSSWLALLRELQAHALAAEAHHHFPLGEIQALTALGRELFDHLLVFENYPLNRAGTDAAAGGLRVEELQAHDRTHYNLDLTVDPGESIAIKFGYNRSIYGGEQIVRVAGHLRRVLEQALARPEAALGDLALLTPAETRIVLETFNATALAWPQDRTVVDLIEEVVARVPAATAVVHGATRLTYRELEDRANQLAHLLQRRGVGPEVVVGLCVERSVDMITGVLGIWKAGGAYVPLDPLYPAERLAFMVRDARGRVMVTQTALRDRLPPGDTDCVWIDGEEIAAAPTSTVGPGLRPENLAYLIYTSGSTGRPKGVLVEHRSLVNLAVAGRIAYGLKEDAERLLQVASLSFDVFASDCLRALTNGGTLVICDAEERLDPAALCALLQRHRITLLESTPGLILPLMAHVRARRVTLPDLRVLVIGSDTLAAPEYRRLVADFGATMRILNGYGVTEATIDTCLFEESESVPATGATPIGRPMANMQLYVLDAAMRACPIGVGGELFIGGAGLARGYHARPELNAERFVLVNLGGGRQRLYRTGDLARWRADGNVEFLGRGDQQVKVRGFRVEPGEIEARLRTHSAVREAVVLARAVGGDHALVAYVVAAGEWSPAELRRHVQAELPEHMIPSHWVPLGQLPLSPNGKIDRRALPAPEAGAGTRDGNEVAPRSAVEETLAAIWCDVLQVSRVGREDDFFTLGGHSLKAMQVASRVEQAFGVRPGLRAFFARPTIAGLAALVAQGAGSVGREPTIAPAPVQEHYALSHAQERLWLLHQLGGAAAYNMPEAYVLERELDAATLERALQQLVARHEALRTAFVLINGEPRQKILPELSIVLGRIDLSADPQAEARAREIAEAEAARPFDLAQPPLLRATLVTLGPRRAVFLFTMHHVIGDGWSGNLLYREVFALYAAARRGEPDPLPPLKIHYKDFAVWQRARGFDRDEDYWLRQLRGVPETLALPYDFTPKPDRDFRGGMEAAAIDAAVAGQLRRLARERRTTVANVVLAVFELVLFQLTKQEDFCVGLSSASRNRPELENLIGFFVNILPVRAQLREAMEFDELLAQVTAAAEEAFEHQEYPFDLLVQKVNPRRFRNRQPLLNVIFAFQNFSDVHLDIGSTAADAREAVDELTPARAFEQAFKTSKFDLTLFVVDEGKEIPLALEYDTGLFRAETIRRYLTLLQRFAAMVAQAGRT
jgi:amino acid adenylation domain-containing protein/non-ribosomal peptide synthase protein (TIGR01720 family)